MILRTRVCHYCQEAWHLLNHDTDRVSVHEVAFHTSVINHVRECRLDWLSLVKSFERNQIAD